MRVYIKVTNDELRLPVAMGDTAEQLARKVGTTANNIFTSIHHAKQRGGSSVYEVVEIEEDEE